MDTSIQLPVPIKTESRSAFGIMFFASESQAYVFAEHVDKRGDTYNGGFRHGLPCGRDIGFDHTVDGQRFYAVTVA